MAWLLQAPAAVAEAAGAPELRLAYRAGGGTDGVLVELPLPELWEAVKWAVKTSGGTSPLFP